MSAMTLQQVFIVEFTVANQMCDDCHRSEAQDYWRALVRILCYYKEKDNTHFKRGLFKNLIVKILLLNNIQFCF